MYFSFKFYLQTNHFFKESCLVFFAFSFFSFSFHLPPISSSLPARRSLQASFPMDVWCLFSKSCGQGLPWESGRDVISHWLRWCPTPKYEELGDGDGLWRQSTPLPAHITSHVWQYHLLVLSLWEMVVGDHWAHATPFRRRNLSEIISPLSLFLFLLLYSLKVRHTLIHSGIPSETISLANHFLFLPFILTSFSHWFYFREYVLWSLSLWRWKNWGSW